MESNNSIFEMPSSFSDTSGKDVLDMEKRWKNFTNKAIDTLKEIVPKVDVEDIPGWGNDPEGQPSANFAVFMMSLIFAIFWITYITFFNSRVLGSFLTKLANSKIVKRIIGETGGYIKVSKHIKT